MCCLQRDTSKFKTIGRRTAKGGEVTCNANTDQNQDEQPYYYQIIKQKSHYSATIA